MYSIDVIGRRRPLEANEPKSRRSRLLARTRSAMRASARVSLALSPSLREVPNA
jgi:hypothetical protein